MDLADNFVSAMPAYLVPYQMILWYLLEMIDCAAVRKAAANMRLTLLVCSFGL